MSTCIDDVRDTVTPTLDDTSSSRWAAAVHRALHADSAIRRAGALRIPGLPAWAIARLAVDADRSVREAARSHPAFDADVLLRALRLRPTGRTRLELLEHPAIAELTPDALAPVLAPIALEILGTHFVVIPVALQHHLAAPLFGAAVHRKLAANRHTDEDVLEVLNRKDRPRSVRLWALTNRKCPRHCTMRALRSADVVERRIAVDYYGRRGNKVYEIAIDDTDAVVRLLAIRRAGHLTDDMCHKAVVDPDPAVRLALVNRPVPYWVVDILLRDETEIRRIAARRACSLQAQRRAARDRDPIVRRAIAASMHTSHLVLDLLLDDADVVVRRNVARNQARTTRELLERLSNDPDRIVRRNVARHRLVDRQLLVRLAADPDDSVRASATKTLLSCL